MNFHVQRLDNVGSTNNYIKSLLVESKIDEGTVILADFQSKGRGRGNNLWFSSQGLNLTFSILFYPELEVKEYFFLTEFVSLAMVQVLETNGIDAKIKWPNDIYADDQKIAGLLIENIISGDRIQSCTAGIGLNVNQEDFPPELPNPVSMKNVVGSDFDRDQVLDQILTFTGRQYMQLRERKIDSLHKEYNNLIYRGDTITEFKAEGEIFNARILGVDKTGELNLETENGVIRKFLFGEVEFNNLKI